MKNSPKVRSPAFLSSLLPYWIRLIIEVIQFAFIISEPIFPSEFLLFNSFLTSIKGVSSFTILEIALEKLPLKKVSILGCWRVVLSFLFLKYYKRASS